MALLSAAVLLLGCKGDVTTKNEGKEKLTIFTAASLNEVIKELSMAFQETNEVDIKLNLASSGTLARQIEQGAGADVYLSANLMWVRYLQELGRISENGLMEIAKNELVFIAPIDSELSSITFDQEIDISQFLKNNRLAIGDPAHVPAGIYGMQALQNLGWNEQKAGQLMYMTDVRAALTLVELGEASLGIVYKTDAMKSEKVKIIGQIPSVFHDEIRIMAGQLSEKHLATEFIEFLSTDRAKGILSSFGFIL